MTDPKPEPEVVAAYCSGPRSTCGATFYPPDIKGKCPYCSSPILTAVPLAAWEAMRDLLTRYRDAHKSMAFVAQEAGASEEYRRITKEVDDELGG